jgi:hypothetical protein
MFLLNTPLRTDGCPKATLLYNKQAAFIGATLCGIIVLHGYAVRLFSDLRVLRVKSLYKPTRNSQNINN